VNSDEYWDWNANTNTLHEDYWVWPSNEAEEASMVVSSDHIEENLIADAQRQRDAYWDMSESQRQYPRRRRDHPDGQSYWDWNHNPNIHVLRLEAIESNLLKHWDQEMEPHVRHDENDAYWDVTSAKDRELRNGPTEADLYWAESTNIDRHAVDTSCYWEWQSFPSHRPPLVAGKSDNYWDW